MQITITARHFDLTNAIRDHVEESCEKLNKYFDQIFHIHMTLSLENNRNIVEMSLQASKFNLQSNSEEMDMYIAVDNAIDKMEIQLKKLKDKVTDHQKKALKKDPNYFYANFFETSEDMKEKLVQTKRIKADPMLVSDAIEKLSSSEKPYMIFKNIESDRVNVLVKKGDQKFKLIEP